MRKINYILTLFSIALIVSCETVELDLLDNPNALPPENISVNDGTNNLQFSFLGFFNGTQAIGSRATRMAYMFGSTYENAFGPGTGGGAWNTAYAGFFEDANIILPLANNFDAPLHTGVIRVMKAYIYMTLVDYWGNVPFAEANQGVNNLNPALTTGQEVYTAALEELNAGISSLNMAIDRAIEEANSGKISNDIPGGSDVQPFFFESATTQESLAIKWRRFANSLKFKYYLNLEDVAGMTAALSSPGGVIENTDDSVAFRYGNTNDPESRHPVYVADYGNAPGSYMSNSYMAAMISTGNSGLNTFNGFDDPRAKYYFYRQSTSFPSNTDNPSLGDALPCNDDVSPYGPDQIFCSFGDGYWGRDHGDQSGIPPDRSARTTFGAYPIGGNVDTGDEGTIADEDGINGEGIMPILMSWQMDLLRAEANLRFGVAGSPSALINSALTKQMDYVINFDEFIDEENNVTGADVPDGIDDDDPSATAVTAYIDAIVADFNGSSDQLQALGTQMWLSSYFSGNEMYNFYRRTGKPDNLQPHLLGTGAGAFPRSLFYPINTANLNLSIDQKSNLTESVFWADPSVVLQ